MDGGTIALLVANGLDFAAQMARLAGDHETASRVEEILDDRFPTFPRRAAEKAEEIRRRLGGGSPSSR